MSAADLLTSKQVHEFLSVRLEGLCCVTHGGASIAAAEAMRILLDAMEEVVLTYEEDDEFDPEKYLRGPWCPR